MTCVRPRRAAKPPAVSALPRPRSARGTRRSPRRRPRRHRTAPRRHRTGPIRGVPQIAIEGGVDYPLLPGNGLAGRDPDGEAHRPLVRCVVEIRELLCGETRTEAPPQLGDELRHNPLDGPARRGRVEVPQPPLPVLPKPQRRLELKHSTRPPGPGRHPTAERQPCGSHRAQRSRESTLPEEPPQTRRRRAEEAPHGPAGPSKAGRRCATSCSASPKRRTRARRAARARGCELQRRSSTSGAGRARC